VDAQAAAQAAGTWLRAWASGDKEEEAAKPRKAPSIIVAGWPCGVANAILIQAFASFSKYSLHFNLHIVLNLFYVKFT